MPTAQNVSSKSKPKKRKARKAKSEADPTSNIRLVPLSKLYPSLLNPRKRVDEAELQELAASIKDKGVLQNLVGRETEDGIEIAAGARRYAALLRLQEAGEIDETYSVPVEVRVLSDLEVLDIATTENVARQEMDALEEADAFAKQVELGADIASVAVKYGYTERTVAQRLRLALGLSESVREAFTSGELTPRAGAAALSSQSDGARPRTRPDKDAGVMGEVGTRRHPRLFGRTAHPRRERAVRPGRLRGRANQHPVQRGRARVFLRHRAGAGLANCCHQRT